MRTSLTCSAADEELVDESIGRPARELVREGNDEQRVDAHVAQQLVLLRQRQDLRRHAVRRDDRQRMRMKGDDRRRPPGLARARDDAADDGLMADVHPVEVADRGHASARQIGLSKWVVDEDHGRRAMGARIIA